MKTRIALLAAMSIACVTVGSNTAIAASSLTLDDLSHESPAQIEQELPASNPANYLLYAQVLWSRGERDQAVFWFYIGELRYRFCLASMKSGGQPCDASLFGSLHQEIGSQINLYAGGDPDKWIAEMGKALDWDASHPNGYTPKTTFATDYDKTRSGLEGLRGYVKAHKAELLAAREQNGIGENGMVNGVYVETRKEEMPKDWSPLVSASSLDAFAGAYTSSDLRQLGIIGSTFFPKDRKASFADTYVLKPLDPANLVVIARTKGEIVGQRTIPIILKDGAAAFVVITTGGAAGLMTGSEIETDYIRRNADGDLVLQRDYLTEGTTVDKHMPEKLSYTFWNKLTLVPATK